MTKRENVTLYRATFAGQFGRNRTVKIAHSQTVELGADQPFVTAESFGRSYATKIQAKRGVLTVEAIEGCEVQTYDEKNGGGTFDIHVTPIFSMGNEVFKLHIGEGF